MILNNKVLQHAAHINNYVAKSHFRRADCLTSWNSQVIIFVEILIEHWKTRYCARFSTVTSKHLPVIQRYFLQHLCKTHTWPVTGVENAFDLVQLREDWDILQKSLQNHEWATMWFESRKWRAKRWPEYEVGRSKCKALFSKFVNITCSIFFECNNTVTHWSNVTVSACVSDKMYNKDHLLNL